MTFWATQSARVMKVGQKTFGEPTSYQRPGYPAFTIVGVPEYLPRLEDVNRGEFYSVTYVLDDFSTAPFSASVLISFSGPPNDGGSVTIDGITYVDKQSINDAVPNQFFRGVTGFTAAANLAAAINATGSGAGTQYSSVTSPHPTCAALYVPGSAQVRVQYRTAGIAGNNIAVVDSMSFLTLDSRFMYGGGPLINDLVTIGPILYRVSYDPAMIAGGGVQLRLERKAL